ncbi:hypothetical protein EMCG_03515 [[Emmonsia] crescens]|uniref:Uncharacterized protein n=1 Tax=[Emmonsia] crescens TaxID=73230 RepID=A0A0G2HVG5_9EURO|nr:hypothetical protein EMCG_03515 [Emmonsia crescens UAMH 3008]
MATRVGAGDDKSSLSGTQKKGTTDSLDTASESFFTVLKNSQADGDLRELLRSHLLQVVGDRLSNLNTLNKKHKDAIIAGITHRMLVHMVATFPNELLKDIDAIATESTQTTDDQMWTFYANISLPICDGLQSWAEELP